jgi:hypothetical protein
METRLMLDTNINIVCTSAIGYKNKISFITKIPILGTDLLRFSHSNFVSYIENIFLHADEILKCLGAIEGVSQNQIKKPKCFSDHFDHFELVL